MASVFPGGIDSVPDVVNPATTATNVAPTLSTRLNLATDAVTAIETYILNNVVNWVPPTGVIQAYAGSAAPSGWLLCNGAAVSRTSFPNLFTVCGTTYGAGDGSNTFNVPDFRGRSPMGAGTGPGLAAVTVGQQLGEQNHPLVTAELAPHAHTIPDSGHTHGIGDPGHAHGYSDPGHAHSYVNAVHGSGSTLAAGGNFGFAADPTSAVGIGITIAAAGTGITGTGAAATGITSTTNTGSGTAHNTIHPVTVTNFIIKA